MDRAGYRRGVWYCEFLYHLQVFHCDHRVAGSLISEYEQLSTVRGPVQHRQKTPQAQRQDVGPAGQTLQSGRESVYCNSREKGTVAMETKAFLNPHWCTKMSALILQLQ